MKYFAFIVSIFILTSCETTTMFFDDTDEKIIKEIRAQEQITQDTSVITGEMQQSSGRQQYTTPKSKTTKIYNDLWQEISDNHSLTGYEKDNGLYWHIKWFKDNPDYLARVTARAKPYLKIILDEVKARNMPYEIALLPIVESAFYPFSYSHGTASGLWQFIPATGKLYGLRQDFWVDERRDVLKSTRAALQYLSNLYTLFGDWQLAIAAYNSGPGRVQRAIAKNKARGKGVTFWDISLPAETRGYVPRLLAVAKLIAHPEKYEQTITPIGNSDVVGMVELTEQLDIALISEWTGLSADDIYELNPALNRFATPKNYTLLLPIEVIESFKNALENYPRYKRISWVRHQVKSGESIISIARKYNIDAKVLMELNELESHTIIIGDYLLIPLSQADNSFYSRSLDNLEQMRLSGESNKVIYTVRKGDSLWEIARLFNVSVDNLIRWNKLPSRTLVNIGDKLAIYQQKPTKISTLVQTTKLRPEVTRTLTYTVHKGDSLWEIAKKFKVHVHDIREWNNLEKNQVLKIGTPLKLEVNIVND